MAKHYSIYLDPLIYTSDLILLNISLFTIHALFYGTSGIPVLEMNFFLMVNLSWSMIAVLLKSYKLPRPLDLKYSLNKFFRALVYNIALVFSITHLLNSPVVPELDFISIYILFFALILCLRSVLFFFLNNIRKQGYNRRRIIILGDKEIADRFKSTIFNHPEYGYELLSYISEDEIKNTPVKYLQDNLLKLEPNEVFFCYKNIDNAFLNDLIAFGDVNFIKINLVSDLCFTDQYAKLIQYDDFPVLQVSAHKEINSKVKTTKRTFDVLFSTIVMVIGLPAFIAIFLITKFTSKGPAFYKQQRIGINGKPFYIYKFRSMYTNAELRGPQLASDNDPRITKWGRIMRKTRLDEFPQFWNVLKGDMSIVGPRPERQHFIEKIIEQKPGYIKLLKIKPGITSMGQVNYGYAENVEQLCDRVNHDLPYLSNMTINSDIKVIYKTLKVMIQCKGK